MQANSARVENAEAQIGKAPLRVEEMFRKRNSDTGIVYVSHHVIGQKIKETIEDGDAIVLRTKDKSVLVRNVIAIGGDRYCGVVEGFEPSDTLEHLGVNVGQEIEFERNEIFACHSA